MVAVVSGSLTIADAAETRQGVVPPTLLPLPVATAPGAVASGTNTSYVLGVNDLIRVAVYKEADLTTETRVDQDGTVSLPLIQTVKVGGRSVAEARDVLRQLYEKDYLVDAHVTITVLQSSQTNKVVEIVKPKMKFTILGQVKKPGNFELPENEKIDLVQAIALADGFGPVANKTSVTVLRKTNGKTEKFDLNVNSMMRDLKSKPFEIKAGDVIEVRESVF